MASTEVCVAFVFDSSFDYGKAYIDAARKTFTVQEYDCSETEFQTSQSDMADAIVCSAPHLSERLFKENVFSLNIPRIVLIRNDSNDDQFTPGNFEILSTEDYSPHAFTAYLQLAIENNRLRNRSEKHVGELHDSSIFYHNIFNENPIGLVICDKDEQVVFLNEQAEKFFGVPISNLIGKPVPEFCKYHAENQIAFINTQSDSYYQITKQNQTIDNENFTVFNIQDITELKNAENESKLLSRITKRITESPDLDTALESTLEEICKKTEWSYGEAWIPDHDGQFLISNPASCLWDSCLQKFREHSANRKFRPGEGLPGRVWKSGHPEWVNDISNQDSEDFPRINVAVRCGLHAGLAVPILLKKQVVAVLVFFMKAVRERDSHFLETLSAITAQLGLILERKKSEKILVESETKYRAIFDLANDGIFLMNGKEIVDCNGQTLQMFDCDRDSIIGKTPIDFSPQHQPDGSLSKTKAMVYINAVEQGKPQRFEWKHCTEKGRTFDAEISLNLVNYQNLTLIHAIIRDISERKRTESELRFSEKRFRTLYTKTPAMLHSVDEKSKIINVSDYWLEKLGYSREEVIGKDPKQFLTPESQEYARSVSIPQFRKSGVAVDVPYQFITRNGGILDILLSSYRVHDENDDKFFTLTVLTDVTERNRAQQLLNQSEELYRQLIEQSNDGIYLLKDKRFILINKRFTEIFGYTLEETNAENFDFKNLIAPESLPIIHQRIEQLKAGIKLPSIYEFTAIAKNGARVECETSTSYVNHEGTLATQGIIRDITDRKIAERELARLASLIWQSNDAVLITSTDGLIEYVNPAFERISGYSALDIMGKTPNMLKSGKQENKVYKQLWKTLKAGNSWEGELENRRKNGDIFKVQATIFPIKNAKGEIINFAAIERDVTELQKLEEQLQQSRKLDAIGQLTGGIAHDFNNILTVINGYSEMALLKIADDDPLRKQIQGIQHSGKRAIDLVRQLLAFSRKQIIEPKDVDANDTIVNLEKMLNRLIGEQIRLETNLDNQQTIIKADKTQFEQILINLIVNARDAIEEKNGKTSDKLITIETKVEFLDENFLSSHPGISIGEYCMIAISDSGAGIRPEVQAKIFEPFFTTKGEGKGTGLGLATVYGIVKQNKGGIYVYSEIGKGTTFKVYWPLSQSREKAERAGQQDRDIKPGKEFILYVEDDSAVREFAVNSLRTMGYEVVEARNGRQALQVFEENKFNIDLVITDVIMPEMSGTEFADKLRDKSPDLKVLYTSGYTNDHIVHSGILNEGIQFLAKPFSIRQLTKKLRDVLD